VNLSTVNLTSIRKRKKKKERKKKKFQVQMQKSHSLNNSGVTPSVSNPGVGI
jgi:hypothetical protein